MSFFFHCNISGLFLILLNETKKTSCSTLADWRLPNVMPFTHRYKPNEVTRKCSPRILPSAISPQTRFRTLVGLCEIARNRNFGCLSSGDGKEWLSLSSVGLRGRGWISLSLARRQTIRVDASFPTTLNRRRRRNGENRSKPDKSRFSENLTKVDKKRDNRIL